MLKSLQLFIRTTTYSKNSIPIHNHQTLTLPMRLYILELQFLIVKMVRCFVLVAILSDYRSLHPIITCIQKDCRLQT